MSSFPECRVNPAGARTTFFDHHRFGFDTCGDLIDLNEIEDTSAETVLSLTEVPVEVVEAHGWKGSRVNRAQNQSDKAGSQTRAPAFGTTLTARMQRTCHDLGMQRDR